MTATRTPPTPTTLTVTVGPRNARTDPESGLRYYRWRGRDLVSVTTARRMAGIPHKLHQWSLTQVIDYALDHLQDHVERLKSGDPGQLQLIRHELRAAATAERDAAGKLGTAVHDAAAEGRSLADVPAAVAPRLRQYLDWLAVSGAEILGSEFQVFNLTVGYAGTVDLLVRLRDGSIWLIDLKTGKGVYTDHALQAMKYGMAEFVGSDDIVDVELTALLHQIKGLAILHLADDGWEFLPVLADPEMWAACRGLLKFATWSADHADKTTFTSPGRSSRNGHR